MANELTWADAIKKVLDEAPGAMHYQDITQSIIDAGLRTSLGATPWATVSSVLTNSKQAKQGCWRKVGKGLFVSATYETPTSERQEDTVPSGGEEEVQYQVISSFGMYWRRGAIEWTSSPKILGVQQIDAVEVDFREQIGIYCICFTTGAR